MKLNQNSTPLADALEKQLKTSYVPFDVPGHKGTSVCINSFFGDRCSLLDKNSRDSIDYLCDPRGVILEAEHLAADAFGAADAFFMVGGTTSSVQAMVMCACAPGDKIILPRNVHYSVINAVILSGAIPVYVEPMVHPELGISLGIRLEDVERCICSNTDAKAVFVNNPTYYGICSDIKGIVELAHKYQMLVLADEAHGTHFYFNDKLPCAAIHANADLAAVSMHKTGGSLTQSAILLSNGTLDRDYIMSVINLTRTTSASYLLMASLDIARAQLATNGKKALDGIIALTDKTRTAINCINGLYAFSQEIIDNEAVYNYDSTKLSVHTIRLGLTGIELYSLLRDKYSIQIEFGDLRNILAICTLGDSEIFHNTLIDALSDISANYKKDSDSTVGYEYITPIVKMSPRKAFYAKKKTVHISEAENCISGEAVMSYPPGIPLLAPGELITPAIIDHILFSSSKGCSISGLDNNNNIKVIIK